MAIFHERHTSIEEVEQMAAESNESGLIASWIAQNSAVRVLEELTSRGITAQNVAQLKIDIAKGMRTVKAEATRRGIALPPFEAPPAVSHH
jgi:hypothetical protein